MQNINTPKPSTTVKRTVRPKNKSKVVPTENKTDMSSAIVTFKVTKIDDHIYEYQAIRGQKVKLFDGNNHVIYDNDTIKMEIDSNNLDHMTMLPSLIYIINEEVTKRVDFTTKSNPRPTHSVESILYKYISSKSKIMNTDSLLRCVKSSQIDIKVTKTRDPDPK
jgi:hypothetical protein